MNESNPYEPPTSLGKTPRLEKVNRPFPLKRVILLWVWLSFGLIAALDFTPISSEFTWKAILLSLISLGPISYVNSSLGLVTVNKWLFKTLRGGGHGPPIPEPTFAGIVVGYLLPAAIGILCWYYTGYRHSKRHEKAMNPDSN